MINYKGLSNERVIKNQNLYGLNIIDNKNKKLSNVLYFLSPTIILLIIFCIINLIYKNFFNSIITLLLIVIISSISLYIKNKIIKTKKKINKFFDCKCKVIRNNEVININSSEITIDDIVILNKGDKILFDAIILESKNLKIDESVLTGQNIITDKGYDLVNKNLKIKSNYVYFGTFVIEGNAIVRVTNIGSKTQYGKNIENLNNIKKKKSPIENDLNKFVNIIWIINIICFILSIIINFIYKKDFICNVISSLIVFIIFIPSNIKLLFKFITSLTQLKFFKENIIVKDLNAIEKSGLINCLCLDKSIITKNEMDIKEIRTDIDTKILFQHTLLTLNNNKTLIDKAIIEYSKRFDIDNSKYKILHNYYDSKDVLMNANVYEYENKKYIYVKGNLENLFDICDLSVQQKYSFYSYQENMIKKGYEVIAIGSSEIDKIENDIYNYRINFEGIIALYNPPKNNIEKIVNNCQKSGIKIILFSNDNIDCDFSIGEYINLNNYKNILDGNVLDDLNDSELSSCINNIGFFNNMHLKQKLRIINTLMKNGNFTLFTGKNLNDFEIIRKSDIGITFGDNISDFEKELSDIILLNNNLETIVNTIKYTRQLRVKFKKLLKYILITSMFGILTFSFISILKLPLFLLLIVMLLYKLSIYTFCIIIYNQQKRNNIIPVLRKEYIKLMDVKLVLNSILKGLILFTFIIILYIILLNDMGNLNNFIIYIFLIIYIIYSVLFVIKNNKK